MAHLDEAGLGWPCANCSNQIYQKLSWLKLHYQYTCPACGVTTTIPVDERKRYLAVFANVVDSIDLLDGKITAPKKRH